MPRWVETFTRVRWGECDLQGHAYYGSYIPWCDLGRETLGLALGIDYVKYTLMTAEFKIRYHRPANYLDDLRIRCWATTPTARLDVHYQIFRKLGGQLLAEANSTHALVGANGLKMVAPKEFHEKFEAFLAGGEPRQAAAVPKGAVPA
jgi:acyl-CoA thioester hydrolase